MYCFICISDTSIKLQMHIYTKHMFNMQVICTVLIVFTILVTITYYYFIIITLYTELNYTILYTALSIYALCVNL